MAMQTRTCCVGNDTRIIYPITLVAIIITINYIFIFIIISIFITVEILTS